jgi:site-specific DNA recombinase
VRFAFYGRVSTDDAQDPSLSIPRQFASCKRVVDESGGKLVAYFWDIESGRKNLNERGNGVRGDRFAIVVPRDGGVHDLLAAAPSGNFDAVIVRASTGSRA